MSEQEKTELIRSVFHTYKHAILSLEDLLFPRISAFEDAANMTVEPISFEEYEKFMNLSHLVRTNVLEVIKCEYGFAFYSYKQCLQISKSIQNKSITSKNILTKIISYDSNINKAFFHLGVANGICNVIPAMKNVKRKRKDQAVKAAKSKNIKERQWVMEEYDRVRVLTPNFEGCGKKGKFIKSKFAYKYSDLIKEKFNIKDEDKFAPATILRWINTIK